ncbi:MAG: NAD(P)/FAD-dependent oxidoreductase [Coriobacteriia bacterium]
MVYSEAGCPPLQTGKRRVVIAGGGYAGTTAAVRLAKQMRPEDEIEILLIEPNPCQQALSELDLVAVGPTRPEFCELWLPKLFQRLPVTVCYNRVHDVSPELHRLHIGPRTGPLETVEYWRLILATGSVAAVPSVEGLAENAVTMWSVADAQELQARIETQFRIAARLADHAARRRALSVAVIGGGSTGIEIVGTLGQLLPKRASAHGLNPADLNVSVIEGRPDILYDLPKQHREKAKARLALLGVELVTGSMVSKVEPEAVHLADGRIVDASVLVFCGGARPDPDAVSWGLDANSAGRLRVAQTLKAWGHEGIYAIGDVAAFEDPRDHKVLPMLAQYAMREGAHAADNILREARGEELQPFIPHLHGQFVSVGPSWGVGWTGKLSLFGLPAIFMKRFTYVLYWWTVGGIPLAWRRTLEMLRMSR